MSRPDSLTLEELRAVTKAIGQRLQADEFMGITSDEHLKRALDKFLERLAHRQETERNAAEKDRARGGPDPR